MWCSNYFSALIGIDEQEHIRKEEHVKVKTTVTLSFVVSSRSASSRPLIAVRIFRLAASSSLS